MSDTYKPKSAEEVSYLFLTKDLKKLKEKIAKVEDYQLVATELEDLLDLYGELGIQRRLQD